jgi:hypothetical protein
MLLALGRQCLQLSVDCVQVVHETVELLAGLRKLREERLRILGCYGFHETTWGWNE